MTSLANGCIQALQSADIAFERETDGALRIPARCRDVGDLVVAFDDGEITVYVGELTHCHFTPGTAGRADAPDQVGEAVDAAIEFVTSVIADKFVVWRYPNGAGGCYRLGCEENPMEDTPLGDDAQCYLWSGPYPHGGAA